MVALYGQNFNSFGIGEVISFSSAEVYVDGYGVAGRTGTGLDTSAFGYGSATYDASLTGVPVPVGYSSLDFKVGNVPPVGGLFSITLLSLSTTSAVGGDAYGSVQVGAGYPTRQSFGVYNQHAASGPWQANESYVLSFGTWYTIRVDWNETGVVFTLTPDGGSPIALLDSPWLYPGTKAIPVSIANCGTSGSGGQFHIDNHFFGSTEVAGSWVVI